MRSIHSLSAVTLVMASLPIGCGNGSGTPGSDAGSSVGTGSDGSSGSLVPGSDAAAGPDGASSGLRNKPSGAGTCASPIDLNSEGDRTEAGVVYRGSTNGAMDNLHPHSPDCIMKDAPESVFKYAVPAGVEAVKITTEGSSYDTVLYVRSGCGQGAYGTDLNCNNDSHDQAPQSILYLTNVLETQVIYIVVDGNGTPDAVGRPSGEYVLTVSPVSLGVQGSPCRPMREGDTQPRCAPPLLCSEGGSPDGTALCVPAAGVGMPCDPRGFSNMCTENLLCVVDPSAPEGMTPEHTCSAEGTSAGAPCRMDEPRCNAPLVCGRGENPICVRELPVGSTCDLDGVINRCQRGTRCARSEDEDAATCQPGG
jgi:hypothetical protein